MKYMVCSFKFPIQSDRIFIFYFFRKSQDSIPLNQIAKNKLCDSIQNTNRILNNGEEAARLKSALHIVPFRGSKAASRQTRNNIENATIRRKVRLSLYIHETLLSDTQMLYLSTHSRPEWSARVSATAGENHPSILEPKATTTAPLLSWMIEPSPINSYRIAASVFNFSPSLMVAAILSFSCPSSALWNQHPHPL